MRVKPIKTDVLDISGLVFTLHGSPTGGSGSMHDLWIAICQCARNMFGIKASSVGGN